MLFTARASKDHHHNVGVTTVYSVNYSYHGDDSRLVREFLPVGSPKEYYKLYEDHLPGRLPTNAFLDSPLSPQPNVRLARAIPGLGDHDVDATLFALPSNQVVLVLSFEFTCGTDDPRPLMALLEQTIAGDVLVKDRELADFVGGLREMVQDLRVEPIGVSSMDTATPGRVPVVLLPERHQVVFMRDDGNVPVPSAENVHRIVYRKDPPYTEEFARPKAPEQLNKVRETLGVVTPYVSLLYGHKDYVESSVILSTVHAVGTASRFRQIWHDTFAQVRRFRETKQESAAGKQTRASLEELADSLGNLEFDQTFSVEFPLMRAMRIESFQNALHEALDLSTQAPRLSEMFSQVSSSVQSEITAINVRELRREEGKQKWNAFAATMLSLLGVSVGFVIAFLGVNTSEVLGAGQQVSMWDTRFATLYLIASLFALTPAYFICWPYLRDWMRPRGRNDLRGFATGLFVAAIGLCVVWLAPHLSLTASYSGIAIAADAILKALGFFGLAVGVSLVLFWLWSRSRTER